jgi:hypothetical protein
MGVQHVEGAHCQLVSMEVLRASVALSACRPSLHRVNGGIDVVSEVLRRKASRDRSPEKAPPAKGAKGGLRQRDPW